MQSIDKLMIAINQLVTKQNASKVIQQLEWLIQKLELQFNSTSPPNFPLYKHAIYWTECGINVGSEQNYRRPAVILWLSIDSTMAIICPLTTKRRDDGIQYHVDLEHQRSTILVEQIKLISTKRFVEPVRMNGRIITLTDNEINLLEEALVLLFRLKNHLDRNPK